MFFFLLHLVITTTTAKANGTGGKNATEGAVRSLAVSDGRLEDGLRRSLLAAQLLLKGVCGFFFFFPVRDLKELF